MTVPARHHWQCDWHLDQGPECNCGLAGPRAWLMDWLPLLAAREQLAQRFAAWCRDGASEAAAFAEIEAVIRALQAACANARGTKR